jgi:hypothetical protein
MAGLMLSSSQLYMWLSSIVMILVTLLVLLKYLYVQQIHHISGSCKFSHTWSWSWAWALVLRTCLRRPFFGTLFGVTKLLTEIDIILVTICCATLVRLLGSTNPPLDYMIKVPYSNSLSALFCQLMWSFSTLTSYLMLCGQPRGGSNGVKFTKKLQTCKCRPKTKCYDSNPLYKAN